jgi:hypothetical protein
MAKIVSLMKPILFSLMASKEVKELVIALLDRYAATTDNNIDNYVVDLVRKKLLV